MIETLEALRSLYGEARERSVRKQLAALDPHCLNYIALSPFVVLSSADATGRVDASPRGGAPGFVRAPDAHTLLIPDSSGNNRLDSLSNIVATRQAGLLFMIPGVDETLRVNGTAELVDDADVVASFDDGRHVPKSVIRLHVTEAYLHCAKAFMRSKLWSADSQVERSVMPSMGAMMAAQIGLPPESAETQAEMIQRYTKDL